MHAFFATPPLIFWVLALATDLVAPAFGRAADAKCSADLVCEPVGFRVYQRGRNDRADIPVTFDPRQGSNDHLGEPGRAARVRDGPLRRRQVRRRADRGALPGPLHGQNGWCGDVGLRRAGLRRRPLGARRAVEHARHG